MALSINVRLMNTLSLMLSYLHRERERPCILDKQVDLYSINLIQRKHTLSINVSSSITPGLKYSAFTSTPHPQIKSLRSYECIALAVGAGIYMYIYIDVRHQTS